MFIEALSDRLLMLTAGLLLAALWISPLRPELLCRAWERFIMKLVGKLNRAKRSAGTRVYRGIILLILLVAAMLVLASLLAQMMAYHPWLGLLELALLAFLLPMGALRGRVVAVATALQRRQLLKARTLAGRFARGQTARLDEAGLRRMALAYLAENSSDAVFAPALAYLLLGLPGLFCLRLINLLDVLIGHKSQEYLAFGWASAKLDDLLMWLPARVFALLMVLSSLFVPGARPFAALRIACLHARRAASPNAGWPLAAMAGALGIALGGPRRRQDTVVDDQWIGKGSARLSHTDMRRGLMLYSVSMLLLWLVCASAAWWLHKTTLPA